MTIMITSLLLLLSCSLLQLSTGAPYHHQELQEAEYYNGQIYQDPNDYQQLNENPFAQQSLAMQESDSNPYNMQQSSYTDQGLQQFIENEQSIVSPYIGEYNQRTQESTSNQISQDPFQQENLNDNLQFTLENDLQQEHLGQEGTQYNIGNYEQFPQETNEQFTYENNQHDYYGEQELQKMYSNTPHQQFNGPQEQELTQQHTEIEIPDNIITAELEAGEPKQRYSDNDQQHIIPNDRPSLPKLQANRGDQEISVSQELGQNTNTQIEQQMQHQHLGNNLNYETKHDKNQIIEKNEFVNLPVTEYTLQNSDNHIQMTTATIRISHCIYRTWHYQEGPDGVRQLQESLQPCTGNNEIQHNGQQFVDENSEDLQQHTQIRSHDATEQQANQVIFSPNIEQLYSIEGKQENNFEDLQKTQEINQISGQHTEQQLTNKEDIFQQVTDDNKEETPMFQQQYTDDIQRASQIHNNEQYLEEAEQSLVHEYNIQNINKQGEIPNIPQDIVSEQNAIGSQQNQDIFQQVTDQQGMTLHSDNLVQEEQQLNGQQTVFVNEQKHTDHDHQNEEIIHNWQLEQTINGQETMETVQEQYGDEYQQQHQQVAQKTTDQESILSPPEVYNVADQIQKVNEDADYRLQNKEIIPDGQLEQKNSGQEKTQMEVTQYSQEYQHLNQQNAPLSQQYDQQVHGNDFQETQLLQIIGQGVQENGQSQFMQFAGNDDNENLLLTQSANFNVQETEKENEYFAQVPQFQQITSPDKSTNYEQIHSSENLNNLQVQEIQQQNVISNKEQQVAGISEDSLLNTQFQQVNEDMQNIQISQSSLDANQRRLTYPQDKYHSSLNQIQQFQHTNPQKTETDNEQQYTVLDQQNQDDLQSLQQQNNEDDLQSLQLQNNEDYLQSLQQQNTEDNLQSLQQQNNEDYLQSLQQQNNEDYLQSLQQQNNEDYLQSLQQQNNEDYLQSLQQQNNEDYLQSLQLQNNEDDLQSLQFQQTGDYQTQEGSFSPTGKVHDDSIHMGKQKSLEKVQETEEYQNVNKNDNIMRSNVSPDESESKSVWNKFSSKVGSAYETVKDKTKATADKIKEKAQSAYSKVRDAFG